MIRFLEANGYDVSYTSQADVDRDGSLLQNHKVVHLQRPRRVLVGRAARQRRGGPRRRREPRLLQRQRGVLEDALGAEHRRLEHALPHPHHLQGDALRQRPVDPQDPPTWTGTWRDPRFSPPADGGRPENALTGQYFLVNSGHLGHQGPGPVRQAALLAQHGGREPDAGADADARPRHRHARLRVGRRRRQRLPAGRASSTSPRRPSAASQSFTDYGSNVDRTATATHHLTLYRAPSGALVFGAGTVQWAWGLDNTNAWDRQHGPERQPARPEHAAGDGQPVRRHGRAAGDARSRPGRRPPPRPTPRRRRRRSRSPATGATLQDGNPVTITGTATDAGGGVVAGVEVSTDGGTTWHPRRHGDHVSWTYTLDRPRHPVDDDRGRAPSTTAATSRRRAPASRSTSRCPCSLWGTTGDAARRRTPATRARSRSASSSRRDIVRHDHRHPLLQGDDQHRHPHRQPLDRRAARCSRRRRSPTRRPPAGRQVTLLHPGRDHAQHDLRRLVLRPERPLLGDAGLLLPRRPADRRPAASTARRCTRCPTQRHRATASTPTAATSTFPTEHLQRDELLGRRAVLAAAPAPPGQVTERQRDRRRSGSATVTWTRRRPAGRRRSYTDHAVHRLHGADADDGHGHAAGDQRRRSPG